MTPRLIAVAAVLLTCAAPVVAQTLPPAPPAPVAAQPAAPPPVPPAPAVAPPAPPANPAAPGTAPPSDHPAWFRLSPGGWDVQLDLPDVEVQVPDFDFQVPDFDFQVPDFDFLFPDFDIQLGPSSSIDFDAFEISDAGAFARNAVAFAQQTPVTPKVVAPGTYVFKGAGGVDGLYGQARSFIDRDQYERALQPLDRLIQARDARTDAAMYWKAYSQMKLAKHADALATLGELRKQFPSSSWVRDAAALEVEVRQASGQAVSADGQASDDLKLLALQGIMRSDPDTAIPVIEKTLAGSSSVRVKERALFVLSQSRAPRAREVITGVAKGASNPDLRSSAIRYLGRMSMPESQQALQDIYRGTTDAEVKRTIVQTLGTDRNGAASLVALARIEKDQALKQEIVRRLTTMRAPEAQAYLLEILR